MTFSRHGKPPTTILPPDFDLPGPAGQGRSNSEPGSYSSQITLGVYGYIRRLIWRSLIRTVVLGALAVVAIHWLVPGGLIPWITFLSAWWSKLAVVGS